MSRCQRGQSGTGVHDLHSPARRDRAAGTKPADQPAQRRRGDDPYRWHQGCLRGVFHGHDNPAEPGGRSGGDRRQHPWYGTNPAVRPKLAKEVRPGKAVLRQHSVRRQNRHRDAHSAATALCPRRALAWGSARGAEIVSWLSIFRRSQP